MGVTFDDRDNDGCPDLVVTTLSNQLYAHFRNERDGTFSYATHATGLAPITRLRSGWGVALMDADNDGWRDLLVAQGHVLDTVEHHHAAREVSPAAAHRPQPAHALRRRVDDGRSSICRAAAPHAVWPSAISTATAASTPSSTR